MAAGHPRTLDAVEAQPTKMENTGYAVIGLLFILTVPAVIIIGFGVAVGITAAIPVAVITAIGVALGNRTRRRD